MVSVDISHTLPIAASSSLDAHIRLWDLENGKQIKSIDAGPGESRWGRMAVLGRWPGLGAARSRPPGPWLLRWSRETLRGQGCGWRGASLPLGCTALRAAPLYVVWGVVSQRLPVRSL